MRNVSPVNDFPTPRNAGNVRGERRDGVRMTTGIAATAGEWNSGDRQAPASPRRARPGGGLRAGAHLHPARRAGRDAADQWHVTKERKNARFRLDPDAGFPRIDARLRSVQRTSAAGSRNHAAAYGVLNLAVRAGGKGTARNKARPGAPPLDPAKGWAFGNHSFRRREHPELEINLSREYFI
jgi:hypothetical protein